MNELELAQFLETSEVIPNIDLKSCRLKIGKLSLFENEKYDVLKFSVQSSDMRAINKQCTEKLECTNKFSNYKIHITIAYILPGRGINYLKLKTPLIGKNCIYFRNVYHVNSSQLADRM